MKEKHHLIYIFKIRPSLLDFSFNVRDAKNSNVGCGHYPLSIFQEKIIHVHGHCLR